MTVEFNHAQSYSCPVPSRSAPFGMPARELTDKDRARLFVAVVAVAGFVCGLACTLGLAWFMAGSH